jgi:Fe2+ or Zn2+ uptake regulation protein
MYNQTNQLKLRPISQVILKYLADHNQPVDAETIWLDVKAEGAPVSIGSIYGHLKKLTEEGIIIQVPKVNRKTLYQYISSNV